MHADITIAAMGHVVEVWIDVYATADVRVFVDGRRAIFTSWRIEGTDLEDSVCAALDRAVAEALGDYADRQRAAGSTVREQTQIEEAVYLARVASGLARAA